MNDLYTVVWISNEWEYDLYYIDRTLEYPTVHYIWDHNGFNVSRVKWNCLYVTRWQRIKPLVWDQLQLRPLTRQQAEWKVAVLCKSCWLKEWYKPNDTIKMCSKCWWSEFILESEINRWFRKVVEQNIQGAMSYVAEAWKFFWEDKALRYNEGKTRWSLVHFPSLEPMVKVLEYGCKKYEAENWKKPMDKKQILNSMMRHLVRLMEDEELDSESNLKHIGHILCNAMFYSYHSSLWKK